MSDNQNNKKSDRGKKSQSEVSIVLNVYNAEDDIASFFDSLSKQTFSDFHLIVVDDGSTDSTVKKIEGYKERFDMSVFSLSHMGLRKARKFGVDKAKGEYVLIFDSDLVLDENAVKELVSSLNEENVGAVGGRLKPIEDGLVSKSYGALRETFYRFRSKENELDWVGGGFSGINKKIVDSAGGFSTDLTSGDLDISWKIKKHGYRLVFNNKAIAYHRDPGTFKQVWSREKQIGEREYHLTRVHRKESLKIRRVMRFYPLSLPFLIPVLAILYWPLLLVLFFAFYLFVISLVRCSFKCRNVSFLLFQIMNSAFCVGFLSAFFSRS